MATTKRTTKTRTACGRVATPVEGEPLKWLIHVQPGTWWVVEMDNHEARIQDFDLNDSSFGTPWGICASTSRIYKRDGATHPGWYTEVASNSAGPYARQDDAVEAMLTEIAQNRRIREEERAAKQAPVVTERHADLRAQWSRIYLVTEYIDKADTAEYRAAVGARTDASQEMARRGLWRSTIGPSSTDPTWETWYEVALKAYDAEIAYLARYSTEA